MRRTLGALRARFPTAYWRARNAAALVQLYAHRLAHRAGGADAYGDDFWTFHDTGDWTGFAEAVLRYAPARSVVDIGCGHGLTLAGFRGVDPAIRVHGFDESRAALARARARGLPVDRIDIDHMPAAEAEAVARQVATFDLAVCLEVAEHLPSWKSGKLLGILAAAPRLVFSAAHPNQGGRFHVNEQPARYWIERLASRGLALAPSDEAFRQEIAALDLPWWYARNIHLFALKSPPAACTSR